VTSFLRPRHIPRQRRPLSKASAAILTDIDQTLAQADSPSLKSLRTRASDVPLAERGVDWAERVVKIYCRHRAKAQRCNFLITKIGDIRAKASETAKHTAFQDELLALTFPEILTLHGYILPLRNRDQSQVVDEVKQLMDLLTTLGFASFINSGTLLGAVREGALLGHDDDVDLAVLIEGATNRQLIDAFAELGQQLDASGALSKPVKFSKAIPVIKIELASSVLLDLFPIWVDDNRAFIWPYSYGELGAADVFPLTTLDVNGTTLPAPQHPEKMLALNYGEGWRSPDVHFAFPWKAARRKFARILRRYYWSRRWAAVVQKTKR
jgi:hypothetical protein